MIISALKRLIASPQFPDMAVLQFCFRGTPPGTGVLSPENYKDEYRIRVLAMLDEKSKGKEVTIPAPAPERGGKVVDIMEALKRSMERIPAKKNRQLR